MKSIPVTFKNKPMPDGTVVTFTMEGCLVANTGSPTTAKPQIMIHLPKTDNRDVNGATPNAVYGIIPVAKGDVIEISGNNPNWNFRRGYFIPGKWV